MRKKYLKILLRLLPVFVMLAGVPVAVWLVNNTQNIYTIAVGESADVVVFLHKKYRTEDHWINLSQGGEEPGNQLGSVVAELELLSPSSIRLDHIYDYFDVVTRENNNAITYRWESLDRAVDTITRTGARPFLSLSYMPHEFSGSSEIDLPKNWGEWESLVQATIEHYSGLSGMNLSDVYYEVWNEPDLFGNFKLYGEKNYLELYRHSAIAAARATEVNDFKLGGPGTTALYPNWYHDFVSFTNANNLRLDFYSWHLYSEQASDFSHDADQLKQWLIETIPTNPVELVISESGYSSENDVAYDTRVSATHLLAIAAELNGKVDKLFHFEIKDGVGPEQFWGRWGLLTHDLYGPPIKKDRYKALEFMNQLRSGQRIQLDGQGSWIKAMAKEIDGRAKILIVNYDPNNRHFENVPITLYSPPDEFTWRRIDFLGKTTERFAESENGRWATSELFEPNSAAIFEVIEN